MRTFLKSPKPLDYSPSRFVADCLDIVEIDSLSPLALDIPSGYGRHAVLLERIGYQVICGDMDKSALRFCSSLDGHKLSTLQLDATRSLPFNDQIFDLVLAVHFVSSGFVREICRVLKPGGYIIYETYGGQGNNWATLQTRRDIYSEMGRSIETICFRTRPAGPTGEEKVSARMFGVRH